MCEAEYGESAGHKYKNSCDSDCDVCGEARSVQHAYNEDGVCTVCKDANGTKQEAEGSSAGAIIGIIAGVCVALGGGGFLIYWFLIRKKKI